MEDIRIIPKKIYEQFVSSSKEVQEEVSTKLHIKGLGATDAICTKIVLKEKKEHYLYLVLLWDYDKTHFLIFEELPLQKAKVPRLEVRMEVDEVGQQTPKYIYTMRIIIQDFDFLLPTAPLLMDIIQKVIDYRYQMSSYTNIFERRCIAQKLIFSDKQQEPLLRKIKPEKIA